MAQIELFRTHSDGLPARHWIAFLVNRLMRPQRMSSLRDLSDRQLRDIGLIESDVDRCEDSATALAELEIIVRRRSRNW